MTNPVARESTVYFRADDGERYPAYKQVMTFCPACQQAHSFTIEVFNKPDGTPYTHRTDGTPQPVWGWDGNLEWPTFTPSMLAYYTVHLCPPDYVHSEVCERYTATCTCGLEQFATKGHAPECPQSQPECEHKGHGIEWLLPDGTLRRITSSDDRDNPPEGWTEVYTTGLPHAVDPPFGNCHSFLKGGQWQFLGDCAHAMAGQTVAMVPLPDWLMGGDRA